MISQEEVCIWFKNLEACSRIDLMCALLDSCLPLELRFLGTYLEYSAGKHYLHLLKWEKEANKTSSWFSSDDFSNTEFRKRFCLFLALLYSHNRTIAIKLFDVLEKWELSPSENCEPSQEKKEMIDLDKEFSSGDNNTVNSKNKQIDDTTDKCFYNEMKLLFNMACLHPAFDFLQRSKLRKKKDKFNSSCPSTNNVDISQGDVVLIDEKEEISETVDNKPSLDRIPAVDLEKTGYTDLMKDLASPVTLSSVEIANLPVVVCCAETQTEITAPQSIDDVQTLASVPRLLVNVQQQTRPIENIYTLAPYPHGTNLTSQIVLPMQPLPPSSIAVESQVPIHGLVPGSCLVNPPPRFISTNVSVNNNVINNTAINSFVPNEEIGPSIMKPNTLLSSPVPIAHVNEAKDRNIANMSNVNILTMDMSSHNPQMNIRAPFVAPHPQFCYPPTTKLPMEPIRSPSLEECNIPSFVGEASSSVVSNFSVSQNMSILQTFTPSKPPTVSENFVPRRCLSESDAYDTVNSISEEQSVPRMNTKNVQMSTVSGANSAHLIQHDSSVMNISKNHGPYVQSNHHSGIIVKNNMQPFLVAPNYSINTNPVISNTLITNNNTSNCGVTLVSAQQQHQQPQMQPGNNNLIQNPIIYTIPITNAIIDPVVTIQNMGYSYGNSTVPAGLNGTYVHLGNLAQKGNRRNNRIENGRKFEKFDGYTTSVNELSVNIPTSKSTSPIPVQQLKRNQFAGLERLSQDLSDSPFCSPSHSPFCSPAQSPIPQRKTTNPKDIISETYATASSWLKSLRLHKYSNKLENYTFEEMKQLDVESLVELGLQLGASKKLKQKIDVLVSRGFNEFGSADNLLNPELHHLTVSVSPASLSPNNTRYHPQRNNDVTYLSYEEHSELSTSISSTTSAMTFSSSDVPCPPVTLSVLSSSPPVTFSDVSSSASLATSASRVNVQQQPDELPFIPAMETPVLETFPPSNQQLSQTELRGNPSDTYQKTTAAEISKQDKIYEDGLDYSDDEVFSSRRKSLNATCYNCGHVGHYGDECTEQTMESQTYSRYAYQLDYSRSSDVTTQQTSETPTTTTTTNTNLNFSTENR